MTINTHIKLHDAAREADLSPHGLLKILKCTGSVIRDDGRWYVLPDVLAQVIQAQRDDRRASGSPSRTNQGEAPRPKERKVGTRKQRELKIGRAHV